MLMPTCSYLAYANERIGLDTGIAQVLSSQVTVIHEWDLELREHPEYGASCYDSHRDGAGICYSTRLRPILNMRPRHRMAPTVVPWQFPADLSIVYWLETMGYDYDVITDEDLHREGLACLEPYNVVINATHAEYYSERMMNATEDYLGSGGRLMYLSGNGYYWVVSFRDGDMDVMEVRRLDMGTRAWNAEPGEHYMVSNGERGGLWRGRGRAPQKILGTGVHLRGHGRLQALPQDAGRQEPGRLLGLRRRGRRHRRRRGAGRGRVPPASSSTATTWRSAPRRTRSSSRHPKAIPTTSPWWWRTSSATTPAWAAPRTTSSAPT